MKGKLAITGFITLESDKSQWMMLVNGLISEFNTGGIIEIEQGKKVRLNILVKKIFTPQTFPISFSLQPKFDDFGEELSEGLDRLWLFMLNSIKKDSWLFVWHVNNMPILINYHESLKLFTYALKPKETPVKSDPFGKDIKDFLIWN